METVTILDILRRGDIDVNVAKVLSQEDDESMTVDLMMGTVLKTDEFIDDVNPDDYDVVVLPGGN